ncbi:MAG: RNA polymerase sporulation sigma factor SigK [Candidatus Limivicinus sp.]
MKRGEMMLEAAFLLLMNSLLLMLRIAPGDSFPKPLSREEEEKYLERWGQGDIESRNILVEHNLRLVAHIIKKYFTQSEDIEDLISIGTIGLIKGINTYKPEKGVRLATYASRCIENEILMHFRANKKSAGDLSLSDALDVDSEGNGLSVMDVVATEEDLADTLGSQELCGSLRSCIAGTLDAREAQIIQLRYGLDGKAPRTQRETAKLCGISRSYVSRLEKRALEKLRAALGEDASPF